MHHTTCQRLVRSPTLPQPPTTCLRPLVLPEAPTTDTGPCHCPRPNICNFLWGESVNLVDPLSISCTKCAKKYSFCFSLNSFTLTIVDNIKTFLQLRKTYGAGPATLGSRVFPAVTKAGREDTQIIYKTFCFPIFLR